MLARIVTRTVTVPAIVLVLLVSGTRAVGQETPPNPIAVLETSMGDITVELFRNESRVSVVNFITYVQDGFYDGTVFHRVIPDFMIQGGGFDENMTSPDGVRGAILNEATNNVRNRRGTIAMARGAQAHSSRSQFFINLRDTEGLDHKDGTDRGFGYAVFGRVTEGMDVVDEIAEVRTGRREGFQDVPEEPVIINRIRMKN